MKLRVEIQQLALAKLASTGLGGWPTHLRMRAMREMGDAARVELKRLGFAQCIDRAVWFAEPATPEQLALAARVYGVRDPRMLGEIGQAWEVSA